MKIDRFLRKSDSVEAALRIIDALGGKIAMVIDEHGRLIGTVSDGDLRRAFLRGVTLGSPITELMNASPVAITSDTDRESTLRLMREKVLRHIPVVDAEGKVTALRTLEEFIQPPVRDNWVVIMAGGEGVRLRPLTEACPKPMLKLGDKPLLEVMLGNLRNSGLRQIVISVNYMASMITDYFGDGSKFDVDIRYVREDGPLGTAGPLSMLPEVPDAPFIVVNGDILTKLHLPDMLEFHLDHGAAATMGVREYEQQVPYGVINVANQQIASIAEKPIQRHLISGGLYVFSPDVLTLIPRNQRYDMPTLFNDLAGRGMTALPYLVQDYWLDIGQIEDLARARQDVRSMFPDE
jgi:dTDP-glucose pyrophosphorylase